MHRVALLVALVALILMPPAAQAALPAQQATQVQFDTVSFSSVNDWLRGALEGVQITNNAGGELRLADDARQGQYLSEPLIARFPFNAIGAVWGAETPPGASLLLEVRAGAAPDQLGSWRPLLAGDSRAQDDPAALASEAVVAVPNESAVLQFRVTFTSSAANASAEFRQLTLAYLNAPPGPENLRALQPGPLSALRTTLTPAPNVIFRERWSLGQPLPDRITRAQPRGVILHQIGDDTIAAPIPFLRALLAYQTQALGWEDSPYHFVVARDGTIFEVRGGGPTAAVARLSGGMTVVHIALIGNSAPPVAQQVALDNLLAWIGEAYGIDPLGRQPLSVGGSTVVVPNLVMHREIAPEASDPVEAFAQQIQQVRERASLATVRSRWFFAEGNPVAFGQRLIALNAGSTPATVRFLLLPPGRSTIIRDVTVQPGARTDLLVNELISDTTDVPAIIESSGPVVAERLLDSGTDVAQTSGIQRPSRVWYFAEGSTDNGFQTYLILFNPQVVTTTASLTYMLGDSRTFSDSVTLAPLQRQVVTVGDRLPGVGFGARVIASLPIVAERTMTFGPAATGFHTGPGMNALSRVWYFAEGTTRSPFQMFFLVLNPNPQPANIAVTFLTQDGTSLTRRYAIPPTTRLAINTNEVVPELGVATTVESDRPVAVERAMYWRDGSAGTTGPGAIAPAFTWRFAGGRTSNGFQEFLLLNNPGRNLAIMTVDFLLANGTTSRQTVRMPAGSRYTMAVHELYPNQQAISAVVRATQPIVAERSLYAGNPELPESRGGATALGVPEDLP